MTRRDFGAVSITTVIEQDGPMFAPERLLPDWSAATLDEHRGWLAPRHFDPASGMLVAPIQSFLIKTPHHTILVDGCFGNHKQRTTPQFSGLDTPWLHRLAEAGATPEDIDFVMCTHLHADHVGWNTRLENGRWVPTFPNATYLICETEWRHWDNVARAGGGSLGVHLVDSILPVIDRGQAAFVGMDHEIEDDLSFLPLPGHTPGHVGLQIRSTDRSGIIAGDLMHHPIQCFYPHWNSGFCSVPAVSATTRRAFLERYAESGVLIAPSHFPAPTFGFIERAGDTFRFRYDE